MADHDPRQPTIHPSLARLSGLIGVWAGDGHGEYPTIDPFDYRERIHLDAAASKPFLVYEQRTWDASDGRPLHVEMGYLRPAGGTGVELVLVQPTGIVEVDEGTSTRRDDGLDLVMTSRIVGLTSTAKEVTAVERRIRLSGGRLHTSLDMAAVGQPLQRHLTSELGRLEPSAEDRRAH